jgi:hypothetical protein
MIIRPKLHWFRLLFVWRGSVLPQLVPRLLLILALSIVAIFMHDHMRSYPAGLGTPPFALIGIALAVFLGFATARATIAGGKAASSGANSQSARARSRGRRSACPVSATPPTRAASSPRSAVSPTRCAISCAAPMPATTSPRACRPNSTHA